MRIKRFLNLEYEFILLPKVAYLDVNILRIFLDENFITWRNQDALSYVPNFVCMQNLDFELFLIKH